MFRIRPSIPRNTARAIRLLRPAVQIRCATLTHRKEAGRPKGSKDHWSAEKLATTDEYPLTLALTKRIHPALQTKTTKKGKAPKSPKSSLSSVHVRSQIVSPDLCDDVLKYIGHTLEQHKGCDILDINPGACLWSQKLHDYLKPRSHILLEPNPEVFKDFLDPLLDAPGSTYKLVTKDPLHLDSYREMVDEGVFSHQTRVDASDAKGQEANNTLLVTGSLVWDPRLPGMGFDSMAKQLFHHFASAAWTNDLFHAFGPVRTLFWAQHDDFKPMVAQAMAGMYKANRALEMALEMSVVVGAGRKARTPGKGALGREPQYELESSIRALRSAKAKGIKMPSNRKDVTFSFAKDIEAMSKGTGITRTLQMQEYLRAQHLLGNIPLGLTQQAIYDNTELEIQLKAEHPDVPLEIADAIPGQKRSQPSFAKHPAYKEIKRFRTMRSTNANMLRAKKAVEEVADIGEELYNLEIKALQMEDGPKKDEIMNKIQNLDEAWEQGIANLNDNYITAPLAEVDDRLNLRYPPSPRIQWDKRPFEPLIMQESEVWPQNRLSLISATPLPRPVGESSDWYQWVQDFVFGLYADPAKSITSALDTMQHGLSDIVKDCPSLTDPKKGGRLQMKHLRVRMLTDDMIIELAQAYKDWPFKAPGTDHSKYFTHKGQRFGPSTKRL